MEIVGFVGFVAKATDGYIVVNFVAAYVKKHNT